MNNTEKSIQQFIARKRRRQLVEVDVATSFNEGQVKTFCE